MEPLRPKRLLSLTPETADDESQTSRDLTFTFIIFSFCSRMVVNLRFWGFRTVDKVLTDFPQLHGVLKLLTCNYEENGEVDARVESRLELETLSVPAGRQKRGSRRERKQEKGSSRAAALTSGWRCPCSWCLCSPSPGKCLCKCVRRDRTCLELDAHRTAAPAASP